MNKNLDILILQELNYQLYYNDIKDNNILKTIYERYSDFDWIQYKNLNPYLYLNVLRTEKEYISNYLTEGRYKGRIFRESDKNKKSLHVLLICNNKNYSIFELLENNLESNDFLTIIFRDEISINQLNYHEFNFKIYSYCEPILNDYEIKNKYIDLEGDFIYHINDTKKISETTFYNIRKHCNDYNTIYIFNNIIKNSIIQWDKIKSDHGIIPNRINKEGFWILDNESNFYKILSYKYNIIFIDFFL